MSPKSMAALLCGGIIAAVPTVGWAAGGIGPISVPTHAVIPVANADNPQTNVNPKVDAGNSTGDSKVDNLNAGQLNRNYQGPTYTPGQPKPQPGGVGASPPAPTAPGVPR